MWIMSCTNDKSVKTVKFELGIRSEEIDMKLFTTNIHEIVFVLGI